MGIYTDITNDIGAAFDHDLSDAVYTFTLYHKDDSKNHYNPETQNYYSNCIIGTWRGAKTAITKNDLDEIGNEPIAFKLIALDAEKPKEISKITPNDTLQLNTKEQYIIARVDVDPSKAVWTFYCSGTGNAT